MLSKMNQGKVCQEYTLAPRSVFSWIPGVEAVVSWHPLSCGAVAKARRCPPSPNPSATIEDKSSAEVGDLAVPAAEADQSHFSPWRKGRGAGRNRHGGRALLPSPSGPSSFSLKVLASLCLMPSLSSIKGPPLQGLLAITSGPAGSTDCLTNLLRQACRRLWSWTQAPSRPRLLAQGLFGQLS